MRTVNIRLTENANEYFKDMTDEEMLKILEDRFYISVDSEIDNAILCEPDISFMNIEVDGDYRELVFGIEDNQVSEIHKDGLFMFFELGCIVDIDRSGNRPDVLTIRKRNFNELAEMLAQYEHLCNYLDPVDKECYEDDGPGRILMMADNIGSSYYLGRHPGYPYTIIINDSDIYRTHATMSIKQITDTFKDKIEPELKDTEWLILPSPILNPFTYKMKEVNMKVDKDENIAEQLAKHAEAVNNGDFVDDKGE